MFSPRVIVWGEPVKTCHLLQDLLREAKAKLENAIGDQYLSARARLAEAVVEPLEGLGSGAAATVSCSSVVAIGHASLFSALMAKSFQMNDVGFGGLWPCGGPNWRAWIRARGSGDAGRRCCLRYSLASS